MTHNRITASLLHGEWREKSSEEREILTDTTRIQIAVVTDCYSCLHANTILQFKTLAVSIGILLSPFLSPFLYLLDCLPHNHFVSSFCCLWGLIFPYCHSTMGLEIAFHVTSSFFLMRGAKYKSTLTILPPAHTICPHHSNRCTLP